MTHVRRVLLGFLALVLVVSVGTGIALQPQRPGRASDGVTRALHGLGSAVIGFVGDRRPTVPALDTSARLALPRHDRVPMGRKAPKATRVKELTGKRTANARFYRLSDGRTQAEISGSPVNYRTASGRYASIDTTVRPSKQDGYAYANSSNTFTSRFGTSTASLLRVQLGRQGVELGLAGPARTVTPKVSGSTVTYAGIVDGADLVYRVTPTSLKESIVLHSAPATAPSFEFTVRAAGVRVVSGKDGSISFVSNGGQAVFRMPAPFMYDTRSDTSSPLGKAYSPKVTQTVSHQGPTATVTVTPDQAWLADRGRDYPVTVDPTVQIVPVPSDSQDVQIYSGNATHNYNGSWPLSVGTNSSSVYRSLVKFPLTGVPAGTQVDSADLKMYYDQTQYTYAHDVQIEARRITTSWTESTATWSNMNANYAEAGANIEQVDNGDAGKTAATGSWPYSTNSVLTPKAINGDYQFNNDTATGDKYTWIPKITEDGDFKVEVHYVEATDRATNAPYTVTYSGGTANYTVDQYGTADNGVWKTLGTHYFTAGTTGKVTLGDVSGKSVIADAVRLTKSGDIKKYAVSSVWNTFAVRNVVQSWIDGTKPNYGFMLKAVDEATLGQGGPMYEASEYAYESGGYQTNQPRLVLTWGTPGVVVSVPTTITATGAQLDWSAYTNPTGESGQDIVEYQVHRSPYQTFTPSAATLVSPVAAGTTNFLDTTATPTPADQGDPLLGNFYNYMVVVKTADGSLIPSATVGVRLPKAGHVVKVFQGDALDTTLAKARPDENENVYDGDPIDVPGNNSTFFGITRTVVKFPDLAGIPAGAQVTDAQLRMWTTHDYGATTGTVDVHKLTRAFDEGTATWNKANATAAWTTPGGDFDPTPESGFDQFTNDPEWETWTTTNTVKGWLAAPSSNDGFLLKMHDESTATQRVTMLSSEGAESLLRPKLVVTYTEPTAADTYYAPTTPAIRMIPGDQYTIPVTVTNPTVGTWAKADWQLSYHWALPDGADVTTGGTQVFTSLPADVASGAAVDVNAVVKTPINSDSGNKRTQYVLKWELYNKTTGQWLSTADGIGTLDQPVVVEDPTSDELGMERFYQYAAIPTGAGGTALVNAHAGNVAWGYNPFSNPGRGLATSVRMTYNSLDTTNSSMGYGWSLSGSTLSRLGSPLRFSPPGQDWPTEVRLTDGDGTTHVFSLNKHNSSDPSVWDYDHPAGVHVYLQNNEAAGDTNRAWVMTAPDRTQFFFDADGYPSAVVDHTGNNTQTFTYASRKSNNEPIKFLAYVTDPSGRQTLTLTYYAKGDSYSYIDDTGSLVNDTNLTNPKIIDQVKSITDVTGRAVTFTYTTKGLMARMVDGSGTSVAKTFNFGYDMTQGNKNVKLVKVTDPRGHATDLTYYDPPGDPQFHWWAQNITSRINGASGFAYTDPDGTAGSNVQTVVTDAENHAMTYTTDGFGRPTAATNALNQTTSMAWDADNNVTQLREANGATTNYTFDANTGYPLTITDAEAAAHGYPSTAMTYSTLLGGHVADLATKTSPEGRKWAFGYDTVGDLTSVTDPAGTATTTAGDYTTSYSYDSLGRLTGATDANGHTTGYSDYDPTGYPKTTTDPLGHATTAVYDVRGAVTSVTDALGKASTFHYDVFGRPLNSSVPKDQAASVYITTAAPVYDDNDNVTQSTAPNGAVTTAVYDADDRLTSISAPKDTPTGPDRVTSFTYDEVGNLLTQTEPDGNLTGTVGDYVTSYGYDAIYQTTSATDADGDLITYAYDNAGNVTTVVDPLKNATADTTDYTTKYTYDLDHRVVSTMDAAGKTASQTYDKDGNVTSTTDRQGSTTLLTLDARGKVSQVQVPHVNNGGTIGYNTTRYAYDEVGNTTRVESPRGVATSGDTNDYVQQYTYDELNRVKDQILPYASGDPRYNTPDKITNSYDADGRLTKVSNPPSAGQTLRNDTTYTYFDNGWTKSSTDPWDIVTSYDYNSLGKQTSRTLTSAGGSSSRTMGWTYYPDGKLASRSDTGVPVGLNVVLVDNSDSQNTVSTGTWAMSSSGSGFQGYDYRTHPAGTGTNTFTWNLTVEQAGSYQVYARYPAGTATNATYSVKHGIATSTVTVDQTSNAGSWVSLGSYTFAAGVDDTVSLSDDANGTVVADAVKLVRDNSGDTDSEQKTFGYSYDANGNLTTLSDNSSGALVDTYVVAYDGLNRVTSVTEKSNGATQHTTGFGYDPDGNLLSRTHDSEQASYVYNTLDQLTKITDAKSASDPSPQVSTYSYTDNGWTKHEVKPNDNTVDYSYFLDGMLQNQLEKKSNGTLVAQHTLVYDPNGNRTSDTAQVMNADKHQATLDTTSTYSYDPRDRVASVTKAKTGNGATQSTESYVHDANNNVTSQTVGGVSTSYSYDRNRLLSATAGGGTSRYNYDPFGRLDTVTAGGQVVQSYSYDGFDRTASQTKNTGGTATTTQYSYDPLDRTASRTDDAGTGSAKTTDYAYLGLTDQLVTEQVGAQVTKSYQYSPWGGRLSQTTHNTDGSSDDAFYGYNPHSDVEDLTDPSGNTTATYAYTAYGSNDTDGFTGIDKPDPADPTKQPYNAYRFNAKRFDPVTGDYDMGFRDYSPGLNQFLSRDMYNGALADMNLGTNPWTGNRYAFAGGNPITGIELDGHCPTDVCGYGTPLGDGRYAQNAPWDPGRPSAGYFKNGTWIPEAAPSPQPSAGSTDTHSAEGLGVIKFVGGVIDGGANLIPNAISSWGGSPPLWQTNVQGAMERQYCKNGDVNCSDPSVRWVAGATDITLTVASLAVPVVGESDDIAVGSALIRRGSVTAERGSDISGGGAAVSAADKAALDYATTPAKLDHIFAAKHNFGPLVQQFGGQEEVVKQFLNQLAGLTPASGTFQQQIVVGGQIVIVRGAVVSGVTKIGTAFTP